MLFVVHDAGNGSSQRGGITIVLPADAFIANCPSTALRKKPPGSTEADISGKGLSDF
jgi:hypothetical protein